MEVRIRLRFGSTPIHYAKKCCFLFQRDACRTVGDLIYLITARFGVEARGVQLFLDDFLLPHNENISIIRDNDLIEVRTVEDDDNSIIPSNKRRKENTDVSSNNKAAKKRRKEPPPPAKKPATSSETSSEESIALPKPPPPRAPAGSPRVVKTVERKSATGGVHLTFHSSSPSSSDSSSSSSSSSSDESEATRRGEPPSTEKPSAKSTSGSAVSSQTAQGKAATPKVSKATPVSSKTTQNTAVTPKGKKSSETAPLSSVEKNRRGKNRSGNGAVKNTPLDVSMSGVEASVHDVSPAGRGRRGGRGKRRGRGRGWIVGGERDVLTVESVVYKSPGESSRGRGRGGEGRNGGGRGGWDVKGRTTTTTETRDFGDEKSEASGQNAALGNENSIWEKSVAGFTEEHSEEMTQNKADDGAEVADGGVELVPEVPPVARDYSSLPALLGAPRVGDTIAFKVLELSSNCTPEVSDYKEAEVTAYDSSTSTVTVKYLAPQHNAQNNSAPEGSLRSELLRCDVITEEANEEEEVVDESHDNHVTFSLGSLLQPKLIT